MELTIIGCSGSFPGPDSAASCYLAEAEGFRMLLDLGNGALGALQRYARLDEIDAICLSHLHGDHCLDMCGYHVARTYYPEGPLPRIPVYGPPRTAERLDRVVRLDHGTPMASAFDFVTLAPGKIEIGPFGVTVDHVNHPVETFGFRLEHGGQALAYSADTGPAESLISLAAGADVLLCEASFTEGGSRPANLHMTGVQAGGHAARAGVGQLVLTHLMPWNSRETALAEAASAYHGPLSLAVPGSRILG
ncbi:MAG TPA: MBL fold metallo-hydrolase [Streptosporangiaceae bacterium]|nr:MBL fold metallo-hydrolase [Streptosporangiaceae bacterium]